MDASHPLSAFRHCPRCGSEHFDVNDARSKRCADCGFTYYLNASAATAAVILDDGGRLLTCRRACEPARGTLDLPGGFVEPGETIEQGMRREIREETGCEVASIRYLFSLPNSYEFSGFSVPTADSFFICRLTEGSVPRAADDAAELQWTAWNDVRPELFGLRSIRMAIERLIAAGESALL